MNVSNRFLNSQLKATIGGSQQAGGTSLGILIGIVLGLAIAVVTALVVTKST
ncbi:MAG: hypothetical protein H0T52_14335, partial [Lautropia sp.]|nr:hypothetical protein [Lautropia sp.]